MGAGQSADGGRSGSATANQEIKTSYYTLLGIDRHATDDEIKKAYRRKALELHPDRNYGDVERTTALFASVQSAYEILSDPQERAWYDSHEDAILRDEDPLSGDGGSQAAGGAGATTAAEHKMGMTSADDITRLFRRFNGTVEFTDAPSGFFGFLRDTFAQLAQEERIAAQREGVALPDYPSFGHADNTHETVAKPFYAAWTSFSTQKSFAWRDRYRMSDAEDRRMRRAMEKENKRFRAEATAEFNETVRALVAFVRKRDPRYVRNNQTEEERQRTLREVAAARAARQKRANEERMEVGTVPEWVGARDERGGVGGDGDIKAKSADEVADEMESESEEEHFECVACRKTFKSEKQFEAHERSKKHVKAVGALRRQLQKEGKSLYLDDEDTLVDGEQEDGSMNEEHDRTNDKDRFLESTHDDDDFTTPQNHDREKQNDTQHATSSTHLNKDDEQDYDDSSNSSTNSLADRISTLDLQTSPTASTPPPTIPQSTDPDSAQPDPPHSLPTSKHMGKAAQKRAKRAVAADTSANTTSSNSGSGATGGDFKCAGCGAGFPSKSRMFKHVNDFGHAAPAGTVGGGGGGGKKKGGKKGRG
ncbi:MAG: hypothetical protein M1831_006798 [Alyxoria varia]|nr:MAG: hypothetical protein M1831_006798 [Alyxoria varia]